MTGGGGCGGGGVGGHCCAANDDDDDASQRCYCGLCPIMIEPCFKFLNSFPTVTECLCSIGKYLQYEELFYEFWYEKG